MEARMNSPPRALDRGLMVLLAVAVFAGAGTIHYQTPMLAAFAAEFHADAAAAGWVATLTFGGFLAGTIFFVPLGDRFDKRRVVLAQLAVLIPALLAMAAAPSLAALAAAGLVVGDPEAVGAVALDAERLFREHPAQVHGIHVRKQQDLLRAPALEACVHDFSDPGRSVLHAVGVRARIDELDLATQ